MLPPHLLPPGAKNQVEGSADTFTHDDDEGCWKWQLYPDMAMEPGKLPGIVGHRMYFSPRVEQSLMLGWSRNNWV